MVQEALEAIEDCGRHFLESEAKRLEGELLLQQHSPGPSAAETCFHQALESAHRQNLGSRGRGYVSRFLGSKADNEGRTVISAMMTPFGKDGRRGSSGRSQGIGSI